MSLHAVFAFLKEVDNQQLPAGFGGLNVALTRRTKTPQTKRRGTRRKANVQGNSSNNDSSDDEPILPMRHKRTKPTKRFITSELAAFEPERYTTTVPSDQSCGIC